MSLRLCSLLPFVSGDFTPLYVLIPACSFFPLLFYLFLWRTPLTTTLTRLPTPLPFQPYTPDFFNTHSALLLVLTVTAPIQTYNHSSGHLTSILLLLFLLLYNQKYPVYMTLYYIILQYEFESIFTQPCFTYQLDLLHSPLFRSIFLAVFNQVHFLATLCLIHY